MQTFTILSANSGNALQFIPAGKRGQLFRIQLDAGPLRVEKSIYDHGHAAPYLPKVFREMANEWKGWSGLKTWAALEGDLSLQFAWQRTGHVTVDIVLTDDAGAEEPWQVKARLVIEVGMLDDLARTAEAFFNPVTPDGS